jgi:hypothetical protein
MMQEIKDTPAWVIRRAPGNGTEYRLVVTVDPAGGLLVTWPDARWSCWASERVGSGPGGLVLYTAKPKLSFVDLEAICRILDEVRLELSPLGVYQGFVKDPT